MRRRIKHAAEAASALAWAATQPALEDDLELMANRVLESLTAMKTLRNKSAVVGTIIAGLMFDTTVIVNNNSCS